MVKYKYFHGEEGEELLLGKLPLHFLVYYLGYHRKYNRELVIKYIKDNYQMDLEEDIMDSTWWGWRERDIYDEFTSKFPRKGFKTTDRKYFEKKGRSYYYKFIDYYDYPKNQDMLSNSLPSAVVHHIFPLVFGGDSSLENLIHISDFHHDILHMNPYEENKYSCFRAVDYLWYLQRPFIPEKDKYLINKYNFKSVVNKSERYKVQFYKNVLIEEMLEFYETCK